MLGAPFAGACVKCDKLTATVNGSGSWLPGLASALRSAFAVQLSGPPGGQMSRRGGRGGAGMTRGPLHLPCLTSEMTRPDTRLANLASQAGDDTREVGFTSGR